jgi:uroporphyrin-3 C-methyltransferase
MPTDSDRSADEAKESPAVRERVEEPDREPALQADNAPASPTRSASRGWLLGLLGVLLGLGGLGLAAYLYYLLIYTEPQAVVDSRLVSIEERIQDRARALDALEKSQQQALEAFAARQRAEREASNEQVLEAVNRMATQAPPSRREWKVAEVAYLLRIANHRLLMERDVEGALTMLRGADTILRELDDFALYQVRAQLADEILSLENVESNDVQGLFLRLEAIKTELRHQNLRLPRFTEEPQPTAGDDDLWGALMGQIGGYLRFRRFDGASVKPLLAPEEAVYLELNLRLMLERAQLAALRREQVVYLQSLETAADWIDSYLDGEDPGIRRSLEELSLLSTVQLDRPLPDISGSLSTLQSLGEA